MITVYVSIGNSDDKLTQREWSEFVWRVHEAIGNYDPTIHGKWMSLPHAPWQNACWCIEIDSPLVETLQEELRWLAGLYRQDSIAWAEATTTFLAPEVNG